MERKNVGLDGAGFFVARVAVDAVQDGIEVVVAEEAQIGEHVLGGDPAGGAQGQGEQNGLIERGDRLAVAIAKQAHDFSIVTGERARPAERVDAVGERRGGEFVEATDVADVGGFSGLGNGGHALGETLAVEKSEASPLKGGGSKTEVACERRESTRKEAKRIVPTEDSETRR